MLDLPTPPLPEAMPITRVRDPSVNGDGRPGPPPTEVRRPSRSSSVMVSSVTWMASTPGSTSIAAVTRRWISAFRGQPATVSLMATETRPPSTSMWPTMPRATMLRRSSGSSTASSAVRTVSWVSALT